MAPTSPPRPWSADTDWAKGDALRFLRMLRSKAETLPLEGQWVRCTLVEWMHFRAPTIQICANWDRIDEPTAFRQVDGATILGFADGSGLVLRHHPRQGGMIALPMLPFVGSVEHAEPNGLWRPVLDLDHPQHASDHLSDDERLFPFHCTPTMDALRTGQSALVDAAKLLSTLFPGANLPQYVFLYAGHKARGSFYGHPEAAQNPQWEPALSLMTAMAQRLLPVRDAYQQVWTNASVWNDPRAPKRIAVHSTTGPVFASHHEKMATLARVFGTDPAPEGHPA